MSHPKQTGRDLGRTGHTDRGRSRRRTGHGGRAAVPAVSDRLAVRIRVREHETADVDRPPRGASSLQEDRTRRPTSRNSSRRTPCPVVDVLEDLVGTGPAAGSTHPDMFDFLEDAGHRLDQASHDLAVLDLEQFVRSGHGSR